MHRFFVAPECIRESHARVVGPIARQVSQVLRLCEGDQILLLDNSGYEYVIALVSTSPSSIEGTVLEKRLGLGHPSVSLTLYQGLLKGDKLEMVLQKGTELGISTFVPILCRRSVPRASSERAAGRLSRWRTIITEAAEQSRRPRIPLLEPLTPLNEALASAPGVRLMAWEGEMERGFKEAILHHIDNIKSQGLSLFVGPEGGFDPEEVQEARDAGVIPVSLGRRILRGETAGLAMAAAVTYQLGELGR